MKLKKKKIVCWETNADPYGFKSKERRTGDSSNNWTSGSSFHSQYLIPPPLFHLSVLNNFVFNTISLFLIGIKHFYILVSFINEF